MDTAKKTAKAVVESELGVEVTSVRLVEEKEFLGVKLAIWRARTQGGKERWVIPFPIRGVYPVESWDNADDLFSYYLGSAFRIWDQFHLLRVIGPPLIQNLSVESPRR